MCGIVGIVGKEPVAHRLIKGLKYLEYRGYDSAGIATLVKDKIQRRRAVGKLINLEQLLTLTPLEGNIGIGHIRWATHGTPSEKNAHPHMSDKVAIVHNGIIENYATLREPLLKQGYSFESDTDTEVVVYLLTHYIDQGLSPLEAVQKTLNQLEGAFALAMIFAGHPNQMIIARRGAPLAFGWGDEEMVVGSDALVLAPWTKTICYLEDGDYAVLNQKEAIIYDKLGKVVSRKIHKIALSSKSINKDSYQHFMLKEIFEQPYTIKDTLESLLHQEDEKIHLPNFTLDWQALSRLTIVACGTSYYGAMVAKYWFEKIANLPVDTDIASEFRYRTPPLSDQGATLFISQSGETADTLASLNFVKSFKHKTIALVNTRESSIARQANSVLYTYAGPEIGVASTKAFTSQLVVLLAMAIAAGRARGSLSQAEENHWVHLLRELPDLALLILQQAERIKVLTEQLVDKNHVLYLGRGTNYPIAMEGALKLKETSYIHAEGYPAGELKHGPIALISSEVPVILMAPTDEWFAKSFSNIQEVIARGGKVICLTDAEGFKACSRIDQHSMQSLIMPTIDPLLAPILYSIPVQLLAYYTALAKGTDVDQPRNLAKSVTVE